MGRFTPGADFPAVAGLFRDWESAVEGQALSVVDGLDRAIAALGLCLREPGQEGRARVADVQIWSDGGMTCRLVAPSTNGAGAEGRSARSASS